MIVYRDIILEEFIFQNVNTFQSYKNEQLSCKLDKFIVVITHDGGIDVLLYFCETMMLSTLYVYILLFIFCVFKVCGKYINLTLIKHYDHPMLFNVFHIYYLICLNFSVQFQEKVRRFTF